MCHEENLSTQQPEAQADARISCAHEHQERPGRYQGAPCEGPGATVRLIRHAGAAEARYPRQVRLTEPAEFKRVFDHCCCKASNRWLTLLAIPNNRDHPRLGLAISRRTARTAVARNRIKRLVRESFRHAQQSVGALDIVVIGRPGVALQASRDITESTDKLWKKLIKTCAGC